MVEGLGAGDFEVTEDGVRQAIQLCEFQKPDPADPASGYYLVGYYVANARAEGQFRSVKVNVKTATAATVEHRTGYYLMPQTGMAVTTTAPAAQTPPPYDRPPALLYKKEPDYSEEARKAKYQGVVTLDVEIDAAGRTSDISIIRHLGLGLDEKAVEAVKQWRYRPASKEGRPIATRIQVEVSFRLL
jgi:TonB family protein